MQVILQDDIPELGGAGSIVTVKDGYARNFLLPRKLAVKASQHNLKMLEHQKRVVAAKQERLKGEAQSVGDKLRAVTLTFQREIGEEGKLFGSVTGKDIIAALAAQGITLDRRRLRLQAPLKDVGECMVAVRLHSEVEGQIKVVVEGVTA